MSSHIGGYTYQFLDTPADNLMCRICHCASREPHLSSCCGHTFCKSCLKGAEQAMAARVCPMCRSEQFAAFANKQADRAVRSLRVFCTNKSKGCQWQGEVNDIINHLHNSDGCKFEEVVCPNDCKTVLQRQQLYTHLNIMCPHRKSECRFCDVVGIYQFIEGAHKKQCPKFPIACPYKCEVGSVPRDDVEEHIKKCSLQLIECEYHVVGCKERIARKNQERHNKLMMEKHLLLTMNLLNYYKKVFWISFVSLLILVAWLMCASKTEMQLESSITAIKAELDVVKQALVINQPRNSDQNVDKYSKETQHSDTTLIPKASSQPVVAKQEINWIYWLLGYSVETQVYLDRWSAKLHSESAKLSSGNEVVPVIVKMSEYSVKYRDDANWFSDPFYTHRKGYKMCLNVRPAGDIASYSTHLSVRVVLMKGPYDNHYLVIGNCKVKLLNQISNSKHYLVNGKQDEYGDRRVENGDRNDDAFWHKSDFIANDYT